MAADVEDARMIGPHVQTALRIRLADGMGAGQPEFSERWSISMDPADVILATRRS